MVLRVLTWALRFLSCIFLARSQMSPLWSSSGSPEVEQYCSWSALSAFLLADPTRSSRTLVFCIAGASDSMRWSRAVTRAWSMGPV